MEATAVCRGAATIVTAFASGLGGAYGIGLENRTTVELDRTGRVSSTVNGQEKGAALAEAAVKRTLKRFRSEYTGASVTTETDIPHAAGLKSSSVAANAIVLAVSGALAKECGGVKDVRLSRSRRGQRLEINGERLDDEELISIGIDAAYDAKVTVTGALDDASAAYFGGYTLTDNTNRRIIYRGGMEETLTAMILVPEGEIRSAEVDLERLRTLAKEVNLIWDAAKSGRIYQAITLNGLVHAAAYGQSPEPSLLALGAGAIAAGISGTGPSVVALTRDGGGTVSEAWDGLEGAVIKAKINNRAAEVLK